MSTQGQHQDATQTARQTAVARPPLYRVLIHNDDYTPMAFVVSILREVFHHEDIDAVRIMLAVHKRGVGVAGVYPFQIAETKVNQVHRAARSEGHPLTCSLEEA